MMPIIIYRIKDIFSHVANTWDKLAPTEEQAINFAHTYINQEPERMIDATHCSLEYYLAHSGDTINERYRQNRTDQEDLKIGEMVAKHSTDIDLVLYRGVCDHVYKLMKENAKDMLDCDLFEKGFLATSLVKGHEFNYKTKLRIYVPAGTKCVYQGNVNEEQYYYEVDVMHSAKLKIISIDNEYINCRLLTTA